MKYFIILLFVLVVVLKGTATANVRFETIYPSYISTVETTSYFDHGSVIIVIGRVSGNYAAINQTKNYLLMNVYRLDGSFYKRFFLAGYSNTDLGSEYWESGSYELIFKNTNTGEEVYRELIVVP